MEAGLIGFAVLLAMAFAGIHLGVAMFLTGFFIAAHYDYFLLSFEIFNQFTHGGGILRKFRIFQINGGLYFWHSSIAIAVASPPPMHRAATPR